MKVKLTEGQVERIKSVINEDVDDSNKYNREVNVRFVINHKKVKYEGHEVDDVFSDQKMRLYYTIDIDVRSWGVKSISLHNITGPTEHNVDITYYVNENETKTITENLKLDWSEEKVNIEKTEGGGIVTLGNDVEIYLGNSEDGKLVVVRMDIEVFTI